MTALLLLCPISDRSFVDSVATTTLSDKFHYKDPTGPDPTRQSPRTLSQTRVSDEVWSGPCSGIWLQLCRRIVAALSAHREHGTSCRHSRSCCDRPTLFVAGWKHFLSYSSQHMEGAVLLLSGALVICLCHGKCPDDPTGQWNDKAMVRWASQSLPRPVGFTWKSLYESGWSEEQITHAALGRLPFVSPHLLPDARTPGNKLMIVSHRAASSVLQ